MNGEKMKAKSQIAAEPEKLANKRSQPTALGDRRKILAVARRG